MPTKRTPIRRGLKARITPEVIAAFKAKDLWTLQHALDLGFAHYSPLTYAEVGGYGHDPDERPIPTDRIISQTWDRAVEFRRQILEAIAEEESNAG